MIINLTKRDLYSFVSRTMNEEIYRETGIRVPFYLFPYNVPHHISVYSSTKTNIMLVCPIRHKTFSYVLVHTGIRNQKAHFVKVDNKDLHYRDWKSLYINPTPKTELWTSCNISL